MSRRRGRDSDEAADDDDWEVDADASETDTDEYPDDTDDEPTVPCPYCRQEILEDSPCCPHCERYISAEDHAGPGKPLWVFLTALACLGIATWWVFRAT